MRDIVVRGSASADRRRANIIIEVHGGSRTVELIKCLLGGDHKVRLDFDPLQFHRATTIRRYDLLRAGSLSGLDK